MPKLTPKQERFVELYLKTGNGRTAYKGAYNATNMSDAAIDQEVNRLLKNPKVALRREEIVEEIQKDTVYTAQFISSELEKERKNASAKGNHSAAVAALMGIAKIQGLIVNKSEDVTPSRSTSAVDTRIRAFLAGEEEAGASEPAGRAENGSGTGKTVPNVPGHGTA